MQYALIVAENPYATRLSLVEAYLLSSLVVAINRSFIFLKFSNIFIMRATLVPCPASPRFFVIIRRRVVIVKATVSEGNRQLFLSFPLATMASPQFAVFAARSEPALLVSVARDFTGAVIDRDIAQRVSTVDNHLTGDHDRAGCQCDQLVADLDADLEYSGDLRIALYMLNIIPNLNAQGAAEADASAEPTQTQSATNNIPVDTAWDKYSRSLIRSKAGISTPAHLLVSPFSTEVPPLRRRTAATQPEASARARGA